MKFFLNHDTARQRAQDAIKAAPEGWVVEIHEPKRNAEQSSKFHAMCNDFAAQKKWANRDLTHEDWKRLIVDLFEREHGKSNQTTVPSLDYSGVVILGEQTRNMSKARMSELIEFTYALGVECDIMFRGADDAAQGKK